MGGLVIHGPSSANYDEAFLPALINDWVHDNTTNVLNQELAGGAPTANSIVVNGTGKEKLIESPSWLSKCSSGNFRCKDLDQFCCNTGLPSFRDPRCPSTSGGFFQKNFDKGKRYLLRLVNSSAGSMFIFSIDGHDLEVIETDLVPIKPYITKSIFIGIGKSPALSLR